MEDWQIFPEAHLQPALQDSVNLIAEAKFYTKLKFLVEILKRVRQ